MRIQEVIRALEQWAPPVLQEEYDNCGLQVGDPGADVQRALLTLDCTEAVVAEAVAEGCGLIIAHHPVIFKGLKALSGGNGVQRTLLAAIRANVAIYAIHTNLDNVIGGVCGEMAERLGLKPLHVLDPKNGQLVKLAVFVPLAQGEAVRNALFAAGAGHMGAYDECSFNLEGAGTFRAGEGTSPFVGKLGERHTEQEVRVEVACPAHAVPAVVAALTAAHPYEEPAFDLYPVLNHHTGIGSGLVGEWEEPLSEAAFLGRLKEVFGPPAVRHTRPVGRPVKRVALCGGSGAFLIGKALAAGADAFVTGDVKYHEFFLPEGRMLLADIGHFESERFTPELIQKHLGRILPTFATRLSETGTNPIHFY
ncbi:MAG: Nif3-like dinuclear metal center hexameric protein [Flavobacteriales bacterium]|mgnify:FL=1|nr:Nif3-like dinuclear metal center hexameric protein [Flavobacteriales bacterium]